jgi:hypothetical protein
VLSPENSSPPQNWEQESKVEYQEQTLDQLVYFITSGVLLQLELQSQPGGPDDDQDELFEEDIVQEHLVTISWWFEKLEIEWEIPPEVVEVHVIQELSQVDCHIHSTTVNRELPTGVNH